jgi:hypothetical protein
MDRVRHEIHAQHRLASTAQLTQKKQPEPISFRDLSRTKINSPRALLERGRGRGPLSTSASHDTTLSILSTTTHVPFNTPDTPRFAFSVHRSAHLRRTPSFKQTQIHRNPLQPQHLQPPEQLNTFAIYPKAVCRQNTASLGYSFSQTEGFSRLGRPRGRGRFFRTNRHNSKEC